MNVKYFQKGFNYAQDGPGNRLVYHLSGCNMQCKWCANPEGMQQISGLYREESVEAIETAVLSARPMFFDGGGLTLTGGEVTVQLEAALELLAHVHAKGIHTCIETNASTKRFLELLPHVDLLIADIKHPDPLIHKQITGLDNALIMDNLLAACKMDKSMLIRIPLIHYINDDDSALSGFSAFFSKMAGHGNVRAEILPYHEYGKDKWLKTFGHYDMTDAFVTAARVRQFEDAFSSVGISVIRT